MIDLKSIIFPDNNYELIAIVCYLIVIIAAYRRFNLLVTNYSVYAAPDTSRPWTTYLRYHASAAVYSCFYVMLFALIYNLFHQHPALLNVAKEWIGDEKIAEKLFGNVDDDIKLLSPLLTMIILSMSVEHISLAKKFDRRVRDFLQKLGSIPTAVQSLIRKMRRYRLKTDFEECFSGYSENLKKQVALLRIDRNSTEHLFERVCHLYGQFEKWERFASEFYHYHTTYRHSLEGIKVIYKKIGRNAERYYQLKSKLNEEPKLITELKRDLREDLKNLLENIYIYIACAVNAIGKNENNRIRNLKTIGFQVPEQKRNRQAGVDPNDVAIIFMFLLFVIPLAAFFAYFVTGGGIKIQNAITYVVWTAMALTVGLISVVIPTLCKLARETSDKPFWLYMRPQKDGRAWFAYLLASVAVGLSSYLALTLLCYLTPDLPSYNIFNITRRILPWALVPFAVSFLLCMHLDRKEAKKYMFVIEGLTTSVSAAIAGLIALYLSADIHTWAELVKRMYFTIPAAVLLGFVIGSIFPQRFRHKRNKIIEFKQNDDVDLSTMIDICVDKFEDRLKHEKITIEKEIDPSLPKLLVDKDRIEQAITSLISNAIEFTPEGGGITVVVEDNRKGGVRLVIRDNGIGMSDKMISDVTGASKESLFEAWHVGQEREDADLFQIRSIVEGHYGRFSVKSVPYNGTEVSIEFPEKLTVVEMPAGDPKKNGKDSGSSQAA